VGVRRELAQWLAGDEEPLNNVHDYDQQWDGYARGEFRRSYMGHPACKFAF